MVKWALKTDSRDDEDHEMGANRFNLEEVLD